MRNYWGGDDEFMEKVGKYFAGTMMEARRMLGPEDASKDEDGDDDDKDEDDESSIPSVALIPALISIGLIAIFRRK